MMKSQDRIFPETLSMDMALPVAPIASPGKTKLV
jgi:hypothetical protein